MVTKAETKAVMKAYARRKASTANNPKVLRRTLDLMDEIYGDMQPDKGQFDIALIARVQKILVNVMPTGARLLEQVIQSARKGKHVIGTTFQLEGEEASRAKRLLDAVSRAVERGAGV